MKILHVTPSYKPAYVYGGPIESIARLCEGLAAAGHTVDVLTTAANGNIELDVPIGKQVVVEGVKVTYFNRLTKDHTHISPTLWNYLRRCCQSYDIVHIHSWWNILVIVAALICHFRKVKTVISPRGMLSDYIIKATKETTKKYLHSLIGRNALSKAYFHATAESEYKECTQLIPGWEGFTLPNILSLPDLEIVKKDNKVFTLIFLSRIHPKKGIELLFEAIKDLPFDLMLRIAGTGEETYIEKLKAKSIELKIDKNIEWVGWKNRNEKYVDLMQADLFTLTSFNENFANVVIESLHMGTPVLISEQVGLSSFIREKDLGWISSLNVESIKTNLTAAFKDEIKRKIINQTGRKIIQESFSEVVLVEKYVENYQLIANKI